ncbi:unnamed protein product [Phyllotreta striolata]|uniref:protein acetyllysine N-acetyltransferase n=1 Tax=Phyllotreta striolata TaxID=444603 RepID=A0A9N9TG69_PHYSR|nr:unnamed protein product [Phyllotreta striolata]
MDQDIAVNAAFDTDGEESSCSKRFRLPRKSTIQSTRKICAKEERTAIVKKITSLLQKSEHVRTEEDKRNLEDHKDVAEDILERWRKREEAKRRLEELEDSNEVLDSKCHVLAQAIAQSQYLVVYTGAGISTAAKIPDYRGTNGIWTRLQQGKDIGNYDLSLAEPTYTHMALAELYRKNILKYVVSQNCDGLHLRSGLPRSALSELHGNMYIEVCKQCKPHREYWRYFDVTENTARYSHKTYRRCYACNGPLTDTIVHFGERGNLQWPLNWTGACKNADKATTVICLGSSLKVLKKYPWLWQMEKPVKKRANLYIVNLQWTPKDEFANVKINGKCDVVMRKIMSLLGIEVPAYDRGRDPIYHHATDMHELELHTTTQPFLKNSSPAQSDVKDRLDLATVGNPATCDSRNKLGDYLQVDFFNNFFLYPYQTSFMYSGLHSIIDPKADLYSVLEARPPVGRQPDCSYCFGSMGGALSCLFYPKSRPVFLNQIDRYSKVEGKHKANVCLCCDYTTDEEEESDNNSNSNGNKGKTQAGWFGKGYRKGRRAKRRSI